VSNQPPAKPRATSKTRSKTQNKQEQYNITMGKRKKAKKKNTHKRSHSRDDKVPDEDPGERMNDGEESARVDDGVEDTDAADETARSDDEAAAENLLVGEEPMVSGEDASRVTEENTAIDKDESVAEELESGRVPSEGGIVGDAIDAVAKSEEDHTIDPESPGNADEATPPQTKMSDVSKSAGGALTDGDVLAEKEEAEPVEGRTLPEENEVAETTNEKDTDAVVEPIQSEDTDTHIGPEGEATNVGEAVSPAGIDVCPAEAPTPPLETKAGAVRDTVVARSPTISDAFDPDVSQVDGLVNNSQKQGKRSELSPSVSSENKHAADADSREQSESRPDDVDDLGSKTSGHQPHSTPKAEAKKKVSIPTAFGGANELGQNKATKLADDTPSSPIKRLPIPAAFGGSEKLGQGKVTKLADDTPTSPSKRLPIPKAFGGAKEETRTVSDKVAPTTSLKKNLSIPACFSGGQAGARPPAVVSATTKPKKLAIPTTWSNSGSNPSDRQEMKPTSLRSDISRTSENSIKTDEVCEAPFSPSKGLKIPAAFGGPNKETLSSDIALKKKALAIPACFGSESSTAVSVSPTPSTSPKPKKLAIPAAWNLSGDAPDQTGNEKSAPPLENARGGGDYTTSAKKLAIPALWSKSDGTSSQTGSDDSNTKPDALPKNATPADSCEASVKKLAIPATWTHAGKNDSTPGQSVPAVKKKVAMPAWAKNGAEAPEKAAISPNPAKQELSGDSVAKAETLSKKLPIPAAFSAGVTPATEDAPQQNNTKNVSDAAKSKNVSIPSAFLGSGSAPKKQFLSEDSVVSPPSKRHVAIPAAFAGGTERVQESGNSDNASVLASSSKKKLPIPPVFAGGSTREVKATTLGRSAILSPSKQKLKIPAAFAPKLADEVPIKGIPPTSLPKRVVPVSGEAMKGPTNKIDPGTLDNKPSSFAGKFELKDVPAQSTNTPPKSPVVIPAAFAGHSRGQKGSSLPRLPPAPLAAASESKRPPQTNMQSGKPPASTSKKTVLIPSAFGGVPASEDKASEPPICPSKKHVSASNAQLCPLKDVPLKSPVTVGKRSVSIPPAFAGSPVPKDVPMLSPVSPSKRTVSIPAAFEGRDSSSKYSPSRTAPPPEAALTSSSHKEPPPSPVSPSKIPVSIPAAFSRETSPSKDGPSQAAIHHKQLGVAMRSDEQVASPLSPAKSPIKMPSPSVSQPAQSVSPLVAKMPSPHSNQTSQSAEPHPPPSTGKVLVLISGQPLQREVGANQERAFTMLKAAGIDYEKLDGADPANKDRRNELFSLSGLRGKYPQFFVVHDDTSTAFWGDWDHFNFANETETLGIELGGVQRPSQVGYTADDSMRPSQIPDLTSEI